MGKIDNRKKSVLIVECDTRRLQSDGLDMGQAVEAAVRAFFPANPVRLIKATTRADLLRDLDEAYKMKRAYSVIIIIGHSNTQVLQLTSDSAVEWTAVANWFACFTPKRVMLLACQAGRLPGFKSLFDGIPSVDEIFATPVNATKNQVIYLSLKLLHDLAGNKKPRQWLQAAGLVNILFTRGYWFTITRRDYLRGGSTEAWAVKNFFTG